jgi:hypothetical protein
MPDVPSLAGVKLALEANDISTTISQLGLFAHDALR